MSGTVLMTDFFALLIIESLPKTVMLIPIHFNLYMAATTQLSLTYDLLEILVIGPMLEIVLLIEHTLECSCVTLLDSVKGVSDRFLRRKNFT